MKRKLSFLLALIFILTLAFGVLPGQHALATVTSTLCGTSEFISKTEGTGDGVNPGTYSYAGANIVIFKQGDESFIWVDSLLSIPTEQYSQLYDQLKALDPSIDGKPYHFTTSNPINLFSIVSEQKYKDIVITFDTQAGTFTLSGKAISHFTLIKFTPCPQTGKLIVSKDVSSGADVNEKFSIKVKFTGSNLANITYVYGSQTNNVPADGICILNLSENDGAITFMNIPVGTSYEVSETLTGAQIAAGWVTDDINYNDKDAVPAIDEKDDIDTVTVKNKNYDPGLLIVKKLVSSGSQEMFFPIKVELSNPNTNVDWSLITLPDGATGTDGTYYISLKHYNVVDDNKAIFGNLPYGTTYIITEMSLQPGWSTQSITYSDSDKAIDSSGDDDTVTVKNKYTAPKYGQLIVEKVITGDTYDPNQSFTLNVDFANAGTALNDIGYNIAGSAVVTGSDGAYEVTLTGEATVTFTNIPNNTTYVVEEQLPLPAGWGTPSYNYDDPQDKKIETDTSTDTDKVTVTNTFTQLYGSLTVAKNVTNDDEGLLSNKFDITVVITKIGATGSLADIIVDPTDNIFGTPVITDTTAMVVLSLSESDGPVTFTNIPIGYTYTVTENLGSALTGAGWSGPESAATGTIAVEPTSSVTVDNTYDPRGILTVEKMVMTSDAPTEIFNINVEFTVPDGYDAGEITLVGDSGTVAGLKNTFAIELADGDSATFTNIPLGTTYVVTEYLGTLAAAGWSGFVDYPNTEVHSITNIEEVIVTVENTYNPPVRSALYVTKNVTGITTDDEFQIIVELTIPETNYQTSIAYEGTGSVTGISGSTYTLSLTDDEYVLFTNLPLGTTYNVTENFNAAHWSKSISNGTGTIGETQSNVTVTNTYNPPVVIEYGTLTVDKTVSSTNPATVASGTEPFAFTVTFKANPHNVLGITNNAGLTASTNGANSEYTFTLSADAPPVVFSNIPVDAIYTVTEEITVDQGNAGWEVGTSTNASGTIPAGGTTATLNNVLTSGVAGETDDGSDEQGVLGDSDVLPQTGGISSATLLGIFGLVLIAAGGTAFTVLRKKSDSKSK